jgi:hypothetical protein
VSPSLDWSEAAGASAAPLARWGEGAGAEAHRALLLAPPSPGTGGGWRWREGPALINSAAPPEQRVGRRAGVGRERGRGLRLKSGEVCAQLHSGAREGRRGEGEPSRLWGSRRKPGERALAL